MSLKLTLVLIWRLVQFSTLRPKMCHFSVPTIRNSSSHIRSASYSGLQPTLGPNPQFKKHTSGVTSVTSDIYFHRLFIQANFIHFKSMKWAKSMHINAQYVDCMSFQQHWERGDGRDKDQGQTWKLSFTAYSLHAATLIRGTAELEGHRLAHVMVIETYRVFIRSLKFSMKWQLL